MNANALDYQGAAGQAVYTGTATMWQGETAVRADSIAIDQSKGDFVALGNARSTIVLDTGVSIAHAAEIRYADTAPHDCVRIDEECARRRHGAGAGERDRRATCGPIASM